jgi:hypothetical protein
MARQMGALSFAELRDRVGAAGGWNKPVLDVTWPDWTAQEMERVSLTLQSEFIGRSATIAQADISAFVDFLSNEGLEGFSSDSNRSRSMRCVETSSRSKA